MQKEQNSILKLSKNMKHVTKQTPIDYTSKKRQNRKVALKACSSRSEKRAGVAKRSKRAKSEVTAIALKRQFSILATLPKAKRTKRAKGEQSTKPLIY